MMPINTVIATHCIGVCYIIIAMLSSDGAERGHPGLHQGAPLPHLRLRASSGEVPHPPRQGHPRPGQHNVTSSDLK